MFNSSNPTGHQDAITYSSVEAHPSQIIQSDIDFDRELEELVREASPSLQGHVFNKFQRLVSYLKREKQGLDTEKKKIEEEKRNLAMLKSILTSSSQDEPDFLFGGSSSSAPSIPSTEESHFHFAFMFSAPLVTCYVDANENIKLTPIRVEVDYRGESDTVKRILSTSANPIMYKPFVATQKGFSDCLSMKPKALHFCGHGIKNDKGKYFMASKDLVGDCLVFEDDEGKADFKSAVQISRLLQQNKQEHALEFVFVASCHSSIVGEVFRDAGAKHVICVDQEEKILDEACIRFTESFYTRYFTGQFSVCESYEFAIQYVRGDKNMPAGEEKKFVILKQESQTRSHSCTKTTKCNLSDNNEPLFKDLTPLPRFHHVPARVEDFIGRHRELHEVIKEIQNQRLLIIQGVHGVGKSSLCREAANFLHERNVFEDGIIYLKAGGCDTIEGLLSKLDVELGHISKQIDSIEQTAFSILTEVTKRLFDVKDTLIIFDNIDDVYHNEGKKFKELVEIILVTCPRVRTIITSRTPIGGFPDVTEKVIKLGTLDMSNARELFFLKSPRQISDIEMKEFLEYNYASRVEMMLSSNTNYLSMHRDYGSSIGGGSFLDSQLSHENINHESRLIEKHPLMIALGGHPQAISLAAALLDDKSLKDVSCSIISDPLRALKGDGFMASGGSSKDNKSPIEISLNTSLQYLKERDSESYKFFGLLGLLPGGAQESDFEVIWEEGWEECVTLLLRYSLIIRSGKPNSLRVKSTKYMLYPFMIKYAEDLLTGEDRNNFCYKILIHLKNEAEKIFNKVGNLSPDSETFVDTFHKAETNFKACLRRELQSISRYTESPLKRSPEKQLQPQEEFGHSLIPGNKDGLELLAKFKEMRKSAMENKNQRETIKKDLNPEEIKPTEKAASFLAAPSINASFHSQRRSTRLGLKKGATVSSYGDSNKGGRFTFTPSNRKDGEYKKSSTLGLTPTEKMSNSRTAGELKEDHVFVQEDSSPIFELEIIRGHSKTLDYKRDKMIFNQKSHITEKSEEESRTEKPQFKSAFDMNEVEPELKEESKSEVHVELAEEESHKLLKAINEPTPSVELQEETSLCDLDDNNKSSQQNTNDQDLDPEDGNIFRFFDPIIHKPLALIPKTVLGVIEVVTVDDCYDELMKELSGPLDALDKTILNDRVETPTIPSIDIFRNQDPPEKSRRGANQELLEGLLGAMHSNTPPLSILDSCFKEVSFGDPQDFLPELSLGNNSNIKSIPDSSKPSESVVNGPDKNKDHKLTITITRASDSNSLEIIRDANGMRPVRSEDKKKMLPSNHLAVLYCSILFLLLRFSECTSLVKKYMNLTKDSGDILGEANLLRISGCLNWVAKKFDLAFEDFTRASKLFKEVGCCLGEAICEAATGYLNLRGFTPSDESMIQNDFDKLEHALKIYNQLDHMYGVYHIHRWLSLLMDKVPNLRARGKRHASEAKRALSVSKKNNQEFSGSHKAGTFVLRSMGDPFSILLEIANFCDDKMQNNSKPNINNPQFNPFDRSKPLITLVEEEEKDLNQTINKGSPEHNSLEPTPSSGRNSSRRTSEKIGLMPCFKKKSLVPIDPVQHEHTKKNGEKNHKQIEDNI